MELKSIRQLYNQLACTYTSQLFGLPASQKNDDASAAIIYASLYNSIIAERAATVVLNYLVYCCLKMSSLLCTVYTYFHSNCSDGVRTRACACTCTCSRKTHEPKQGGRAGGGGSCRCCWWFLKFVSVVTYPRSKLLCTSLERLSPGYSRWCIDSSLLSGRYILTAGAQAKLAGKLRTNK